MVWIHAFLKRSGCSRRSISGGSYSESLSTSSTAHYRQYYGIRQSAAVWIGTKPMDAGGGSCYFTVGEVLMFTLMDVLVDRIAKPELKGTYFGMIGFNNLGNVSAPILGGFLLDSFGANEPMLVFAPIAISAVCGVPFVDSTSTITGERTATNDGKRTGKLVGCVYEKFKNLQITLM